MTNEIVAAITAYTRRGWAVFPVRPQGKAPATPHGFKDATKDTKAALAAFAKVPDANIGIACEASGLVVVDIDPRNGGSPEKFWELVGTSTPPTPPPTAKTGSGGVHYYFSGPSLKSCEPVPGIEIKSQGVYVLAPPSFTTAAYEWALDSERLVPPDLPSTIRAICAERGRQGTKEGEVVPIRTFVKGERRSKLFEILGAARKRGLGREALLALATEANATQFEPPIEGEEVSRMVENVLKYPGEAPPELVARSFAEIVTAPSPFPRPVINNIILESQINMVCGAAMTGKSILALDMAISIGGGVPFLGQEKFRVPKQRVVTYLYGEQAVSLWELRIRAIAEHRGVKPQLFLADGSAFALNKPSHVDELLTFMHKVESDILFIDPLVVMFPVEDENDANEVSKAIRGTLQQLVARGVTPIVVHHASKAASGKEPGSARELVRGSGDLTAMLGAIVGVWSSGQGRRVKVMTSGRLNTIPPFAVRPGPKVSGLGGLVDIEDLALGLDEVEPPVYDGEWKYEDGAEAPEVPDGAFTAHDAQQLWGLGSIKAAHNRLGKLAASGVVLESEEPSGGGRPRKVWRRA